MSYLQKAETALSKEQFEEALGFASKALGDNPSSYRAYLVTAKAAQRLKRYDGALVAGDNAAALANQSGRREAIGDAQMRRAAALFMLKRFKDAEAALDYSARFGFNERSIELWRAKVKAALDSGAEDTSTGIEEFPTFKTEEAPKPKIEELDDEDEDEDVKSAVAEKEQHQRELKKAQAKKDVYDANNVRSDWYQSSSSIDASLFLKNAPKEQTTVKFTATSAVVKTKQPSDGSDFEYTLGPLHMAIDPAASSFRIFGTKIELTLVKAEPGSKWEKLTDNETKKPEASLETIREALNDPDKPREEPKLPGFFGNKNWEKLAEAELEKQGKEEEDGDPNAFFKQLYANADEDTRRAMMKSYVESNGTALSTDWNEVKKAKVKTDPPTGMEAKYYH
ncbi:protein Sgt1p [Trichomonascus vanleenenianus]|uniref:co-chaperone SGT1 n=1 Tax=Trichomonascus vanleenenianus TaxID=2268995 RepID=UPI003ECB7444